MLALGLDYSGTKAVTLAGIGNLLEEYGGFEEKLAENVGLAENVTLAS